MHLLTVWAAKGEKAMPSAELFKLQHFVTLEKTQELELAIILFVMPSDHEYVYQEITTIDFQTVSCANKRVPQTTLMIFPSRRDSYNIETGNN
jgi:hypothetical protein